MELQPPAQIIAGAAEVAAEETVAAINQAAELNDDPVVAGALDTAAVTAQKASGRVGWLRHLIDRWFSGSLQPEGRQGP